MLARPITSWLVSLLVWLAAACVQQPRAAPSASHAPCTAALADQAQQIAALTQRVDDLQRELEVLRGAQTEAYLDKLLGSPAPAPVADAEVASAAVATPATPASEAKQSVAVAGVTVYVTPSGKKYHTASCRYASSGSALALTEATGRYEPCKVCQPPTSTSALGATPTKTSASSAPARSSGAVTGGQCAATTQKGSRCKRSAKAGSSYCWQHGT